MQAVGIRAKLQTIERGVFLKRLQGGLKEWPGQRTELGVGADHPHPVTFNEACA